MTKKRINSEEKKSEPLKKHSIEKSLAENLISLQKVHIGLAEKFDKLANEISQLLALFEITARTFTKNLPMAEHEKDKEFLEKIDKLLEQNKILAKGLTLMEERLRERTYNTSTPSQMQQEQKPNFPSSGKPLPKF